jgi:hypothetical protein
MQDWLEFFNLAPGFRQCELERAIGRISFGVVFAVAADQPSSRLLEATGKMVEDDW